jgi:hypothetical protein
MNMENVRVDSFSAGLDDAGGSSPPGKGEYTGPLIFFACSEPVRMAFVFRSDAEKVFFKK